MRQERIGDLGTRELLRIAYQYASDNSLDTSTHNGSVLVTSDGEEFVRGTNRLPPGVKPDDRRLNQRPDKYDYMEHAERWAIYTAARQGVPTERATLYVPWYACKDCARGIIVAGIKRVVGHKQMFDKTPERWRESIAIGDEMLDEAGVIRDIYDGPIGGVRVLFNGEHWEP